VPCQHRKEETRGQQQCPGFDNVRRAKPERERQHGRGQEIGEQQNLEERNRNPAASGF
jgi:hypothetical protein